MGKARAKQSKNVKHKNKIKSLELTDTIPSGY